MEDCAAINVLGETQVKANSLNAAQRFGKKLQMDRRDAINMPAPKKPMQSLTRIHQLHPDMVAQEWKLDDGRIGGYIFNPEQPEVAFYELPEGQVFKAGVTDQMVFNASLWATFRKVFYLGPKQGPHNTVDVLFKVVEGLKEYDSVRLELFP